MSQNRLDNIVGLGSLGALVALNIGACLKEGGRSLMLINMAGGDNQIIHMGYR